MPANMAQLVCLPERGKNSASRYVLFLQVAVDTFKPGAHDAAFSSRPCFRPDARGLAVERATALAPAAAGHLRQ